MQCVLFLDFEISSLQVELKAISQLAFGGSNTMALFGLGAICRWGSDERGFSDKKGALEYHRNVEIPGCIEKVLILLVNLKLFVIAYPSYSQSFRHCMWTRAVILLEKSFASIHV